MDKKHKQKLSDAMMGDKNPNYGKKLSKETRKKISLSMRGKNKHKKSQEHRQKISDAMIGDKNPKWKDSSHMVSKYKQHNHKHRKRILIRDNYECQNPTCRGNCKLLNVHHIDYDKENCEPENLIVLCVSCNSRANHNRKYWTKFYMQLSQGKNEKTTVDIYG